MSLSTNVRRQRPSRHCPLPPQEVCMLHRPTCFRVFTTQNTSLREAKIMIIFTYLFQNVFHRHTKNKNTKNTTFRKKFLTSSGPTVKNPDTHMLAVTHLPHQTNHKRYQTWRVTNCNNITITNYNSTRIWTGTAVAQLVEALRYKPEGRGFDSRWCHWNFSLT
jgi:hypothetical protein